jgi:hypothetical protein
MAPPTVRNSHTAAQKAFIVRKLAAFEAPRAIAAAFAAVFPDTSCNENDILALDPDNAAQSFELHTLFMDTRKRVLADPDSAPFAAQQARLIALSNQAKFYAGNNQFGEQRAVLRQIAEEQGAIGASSKTKPGAAPVAAEQIEEIRVTYIDPKPPEPATV